MFGNMVKARTPKVEEKAEEVDDREECPHCGKKYKNIARHLPYCKENPDNQKEVVSIDSKQLKGVVATVKGLTAKIEALEVENRSLQLQVRDVRDAPGVGFDPVDVAMVGKLELVLEKYKSRNPRWGKVEEPREADHKLFEEVSGWVAHKLKELIGSGKTED